MITTTIDVGQIIIASLIAIVGWFTVTKLNGIDSKLEKHDKAIFDMWGLLNRLLVKYRIDPKEMDDD
jgi:hypothetical protein